MERGGEGYVESDKETHGERRGSDRGRMRCIYIYLCRERERERERG